MTLPLWLSAKLAVIVIVSPTKNVDGDVDKSPLSVVGGGTAIGIEAWATEMEPIHRATNGRRQRHVPG